MAQIRGRKKRIIIPPQVIKDLDPKESLLPATIDLRNLRISKAGNTFKRNGYAQKWDIANDVPVNLLIPESVGYAIDDSGIIYKLSSTIATLDHKVAPKSRPSWVTWDKNIYLWSGGTPIKITSSNTEVVGGTPVRARFVAVVGGYMVVSGHNDTEFRWPVNNNPDNWTITDGAGLADIEKVGTIQNMIEYKKHVLFFTETHIEVRALSGSTTLPFVINNSLHVNKGLAAPNSVVKASDDRVYWLGRDIGGNIDFFTMDNFSVKNISTDFSRELFTMNNSDKIKGFDIPKEKHIKWVSQEDGKTYIYDYENNSWSEDNLWMGSGWEAFRMNSYMEHGGKQYFGDVGCTGLIHEISDDYLDDNGAEIRTLRQFAVQPSESGNRVRMNRLRFRRKGGTGTLSETSPQMLLEYRWDKQPFRPYPNLAQGAMGVNDPYVDAHNLGIGTELEIRLTEMQDTEYLVTDAVATYEELRG